MQGGKAPSIPVVEVVVNLKIYCTIICQKVWISLDQQSEVSTSVTCLQICIYSRFNDVLDFSHYIPSNDIVTDLVSALPGNASVNIHVRNNRRTVFYMWSALRPLLCNVAVNTPLQQRSCDFCVVRAEELS
jgi:hypothetical protein